MGTLIAQSVTCMLTEPDVTGLDATPNEVTNEFKLLNKPVTTSNIYVCFYF